MSYIHLTEKEIYAIEFYIKEKIKPLEISKKLNRDPSTITREIKRYSNPINWKYEAEYAIYERKQKKKIINIYNKTRIKIWRDDELIKYIISKIKLYWSPEQISWELKEEKQIIISKDTIYKFIYENHQELIKKYFRRKWRKYIHDRKSKCQLPNRTMIDERPEIINKRERIWDWEWDLIIWKMWNKKAILTYVERKSWYLKAKMLNIKNSQEVLKETINIFKKISINKRYSITYDNWWEFKEHLLIKIKTKMNIYFAHPYSSWERWTNENTNWLIRQFFQKWTDFTNISDEKLQYYVKLINSRPRKRLNFLTPINIFYS